MIHLSSSPSHPVVRLLVAAAIFLLLGGTAIEAGGTEAFLVAPKKVFPGSSASITIRVFSDDSSPCAAAYAVWLQGGTEGDVLLHDGRTDASGWDSFSAAIPPDEVGGPRILSAEVEGIAGRVEAGIALVDAPALIIETDKPIYKPGQTILGRVILLSNGLLPLETDVAVTVRDGKGNKLWKGEGTSNEYGVHPFEIPLATEVNIGEWKIEARSGEGSTDVTVRVEPYALPRFRLEATLDREWFLDSNAISGTVRSSYFFGKDVEGQVLVIASKYEDGAWAEYARSSSTLAGGAARFEIPARQGVQDGVTLDISVVDTAGHPEKTKLFVPIAAGPHVVRILPQVSAAKPGFPLDVAIETADPAGRPVSLPLRLLFYANDEEGSQVSSEARLAVTQGGRARVTYTVPEEASYILLEAETNEDGSSPASVARLYCPVAESPTGSFICLRRATDATAIAGQNVRFDLLGSRPGETFWEVRAAGRSVRSGKASSDTIEFMALPGMAPEARIIAYRVFPGGEVGTDSIVFRVGSSPGVDLQVAFDAAKVEPGTPVKVEIAAGAPSMVGLSIVDESVLALGQSRLEMARLYQEIRSRFGGPSEEQIRADFIERPHTVGSRDILIDAGLTVAMSPGAGPALPRGREFFPGGSGVKGGYGLEDGTGGGSGEVAPVERVRQFFPETWVWEPMLRTDSAGRATLELIAPDSLTNWKLRATSTSGEGIGIASGDLTVFQDFFVEPDLPYSVIRGEDLWLPVAVYNYLDTPQTVGLTLESSGGLSVLEESLEVEVGANSVKGARFPVRAASIGTFPFKLTALGPRKSDALIRSIRIDAEGVPQQAVENRAITAGETGTFTGSFPAGSVGGSERILLTITGSQVAQTLRGVEDLCGVPYG